MVRQKAILDLALQFDNACTAKNDLRKAYEKCNDIPQESRALIDTFLKEESDKDYELNLSMYESLDIDDSDLRLTPVLRPSSSTRVETSPSTQNPVRIIPGPVGIVQAVKLLKQRDILLGLDGAVMSTQEYMKKVVEDWVFMRHQELSQNGKLDQIVAIVKSCSSNVIGDLTVTVKDLSSTILGTIHHKSLVRVVMERILL
ncbi:hypothetical protein Tco_0464483 [Tanacetum coccineum]